MLRRERLTREARVLVRLSEGNRSGTIASEGIVVDGLLYFEVRFGPDELDLVPDADLMPELTPADMPDRHFVAELTVDRRKELTRVARNALKKLGELYHEDVHLIEELLQNAEDAEASVVTFTITPEEIVAINNGLPFSRRDVEKITDVVEERSKQPGQIGRHGIGFRSVYAVTKQPRIISGSAAFAIEGYLIPKVLAMSEGPVWGTTFGLPFKVPTARTEQPYPRFFADQLAHFSKRMLLFLRNVWHLRITSETDPPYELKFSKTEEEDVQTGGVLVRIFEGTGTGLSETFLLFRDPSSGEVNDAVEVAFRLQDGELAPCGPDVLHVFLPTKQVSSLPFLVNGDFTPTKPRDGIIEDDPRNSILLGKVGRLIAKAAPQLRAVGQQPARLLQVLPRKGHAEAQVFEPLVSASHEILRLAPIVPIRGGGWAAPGQALLLKPEDTVLRELLTDKDLAFVCGQPRALVELPDTADSAIYELLNELGVEVFGPDQLLNLLTSPHHLAGRPPAWFAKLYSYHYFGDFKLVTMLARERLPTSAPVRAPDSKDTES